jgi:hypothetical protein
MRRINGKNVTIEFGYSGIEVKIEGYGCQNSPIGVAGIVYVDLYPTHPQVLVHHDITEEEPTIIKLEGASEKLRAS